MILTPTQKEKILQIVSVFETSSTKKKYGTLVIAKDGPNIAGTKERKKQITYGAHQTTEYGLLKVLLTMYVKAPGALYARQLKPYLSFIGKTPLHANEPFKRHLIFAANDKVMQKTQDLFFEKYFFTPALNWATIQGFTLPLSMAVIYDSYIHSGGIPGWLRDDFRAVPPAAGGTEKLWIEQYVNARDMWLENHSDKILRNTDYRTDTWKEQIKNQNWFLLSPVVVKFNSENKADWITI